MNTPTHQLQKKKVIIDCDPGIDDALALMLACASDEIDLLGVTIVSGNTPLETCAQNALDILHLMGRDDVPVYLGADRPQCLPAHHAEDTHGANGLGDYALEPSPRAALAGADTFLKQTLENEDDVTVIAIGPLTNIARLVNEHPQSAKKMEQLVLMGGAFKSHGNCSPVAEFNFWYDPHAARDVFEKLGRPITMTGLDVTREVLLTPNYVEMIRQFGGARAEAIAGMTQFYTDFHWKKEHRLGCVINDPLAVAQFLDPTICGGEDYYVQIITEGPAAGMSMVDVEGILGKAPNCRVLTTCDYKKFFKNLFTALFPQRTADIDMVLEDERYGA